MKVTEELFKEVNVTVTKSNEMENAEAYLRAQYKLPEAERVIWIYSASFAQWTNEKLSEEWSANVKIPQEA